MLVRTAQTATDIARIANIAQQIWHDSFSHIVTHEQIDYMIERFQSFNAIQEQLQNQGYTYYMVEMDDKLVAFCGVNISDDGKMFLSKMYVQSEYRSRGILSHVLKMLFDRCKKDGQSAIWLTTNKKNEAAISKYKHLGFEVVSERCTDIGFGYLMDDYIMEIKVK